LRAGPHGDARSARGRFRAAPAWTVIEESPAHLKEPSQTRKLPYERPAHAGRHFQVEMVAVGSVVVGRQKDVEQARIVRFTSNFSQLGRARRGRARSSAELAVKVMLDRECLANLRLENSRIDGERTSVPPANTAPERQFGGDWPVNRE